MTLRSTLRISVAAFTIAVSQVFAADAPRSDRSEAAEKERDYVRYVGDNLRGKLETVVVTLKNAAGARVDLIGAVHIADAAYYQALTKLFTGYEALLFELVDGQRLKESMEGGAAPTKNASRAKEEDDEGESKPSPAFAVLRSLMQGAGNYLRLQYQTDGIDYSARNFVHADVSLAEFLRLQEEKGESFATLFQKSFEAQLGRGSRKDEEPTGGQLLLALLGDSSGIKIAMAKMLGKAEGLTEEIGLGSKSVIVGERNRVALEVFDRQLKAGRKHLGIFYGAAHLPDLEKRLVDRGFRRTEERWLTAWDIKPRVDEKKENKQ